MAQRKSPPLRTWVQVPIGIVLQTERGIALAHVWQGRDGLWRGSTTSKHAEIHGPYSCESEAKNAMAERV